jgi:hypothetical protein
LAVQCYDEDPGADDLIGQGIVNLDSIFKMGTQDLWVDIRGKKGENAGSIRMVIFFRSKEVEAQVYQGNMAPVPTPIPNVYTLPMNSPSQFTPTQNFYSSTPIQPIYSSTPTQSMFSPTQPPHYITNQNYALPQQGALPLKQGYITTNISYAAPQAFPPPQPIVKPQITFQVKSTGIAWQKIFSGNLIPVDAIKCGSESNGEPLYVGRAFYQVN